jgi:hypothetical protein
MIYAGEAYKKRREAPMEPQRIANRPKRRIKGQEGNTLWIATIAWRGRLVAGSHDVDATSDYSDSHTH